MPLNELDTRFPERELVAAREKIPDWLSDVSAILLLVPGIVHPCKVSSLNGNGQMTVLYFTLL